MVEAVGSAPFLQIRDPDGTELVRIEPDGTIVYGENYEPDKAAKIFWAAMGKFRPPPVEVQQKVIKHYHEAMTSISKLFDDAKLFLDRGADIGNMAVDIAEAALRKVPHL